MVSGSPPLLLLLVVRSLVPRKSLEVASLSVFALFFKKLRNVSDTLVSLVVVLCCAETSKMLKSRILNFCKKILVIFTLYRGFMYGVR